MNIDINRNPSNTEDITFSCKNCFKKDDCFEFTLEEFKKVRGLCKANFWYQEVKHLPEIKKRINEIYEKAELMREEAFINGIYAGCPEYLDTGAVLIDDEVYDVKYFDLGGGLGRMR